VTEFRPAHLDSVTFEQALAVLERERPSPLQDHLFRVLSVLIWGAIGLTALYLLLQTPALAPGLASFHFARAAAVFYVLIIPVFVLNWQLVIKLRTAAKMRNRLATSWKRRLMQSFVEKRRQRRLSTLATLALSGLGYVVGSVGVVGLVMELTRNSTDGGARLTVAAVMIVFGISCIFVHFMARGRERIEVIGELRSSLLRQHTAGSETQVAGALYDQITRIERTQIAADRLRSIKAAAAIPAQELFSLKEHRGVHQARVALPPPAAASVQAYIDRLLANPGADGDIQDTADGISHVRVPDTVLEIGFTVDWTAREIKLLSLGSAVDVRSSTSLHQNEGGGER